MTIEPCKKNIFRKIGHKYQIIVIKIIFIYKCSPVLYNETKML